MKKLNKKKILFVTSNRADYGLLSNLIRKVQNKKKIFQSHILVLGQHLDFKFGKTIFEIKEEKILNVLKMKKKIFSSKSKDLTYYLSEVLKTTNQIISQKKFDLIVILGDRFEILGPVIAAFLNNTKIAHIHGGEKTYGSKDDSIRHSISKMSNYHFVSHIKYKERLIQLGEKKKNIFLVGGLGAERIKNLKALQAHEIEKKLKIKFKKKNFLITFNSFEENVKKIEKKLNLFLNVLEKFKNTNYLFTSSNPDLFSDLINKKINNFCKKNKNAFYFKSLGFLNYVSLLKKCDLIIGNSSSGILEAPSFGVPTINLGDRQKGRIFSKSVIQTSFSKKKIYEAIKKMQNKKFAPKNPYYIPNSSYKIIKIFEKLNLRNENNFKEFVDLKI